MIRVATVLGARPQFIKAAVVSRALASRPSVEEHLIHTGQHFDANMSTVFFDELDMRPPACHLGIGGGSHGQNTGRMIEGIERVLTDMAPDWVLVFGDTDSTLAATLAAVKLHVPVAHVEAGLRSFNRRMPEEVNRVLTDHAATMLLVPTEAGIRNLAAEGINGQAVRLVGDVMYDAALHYGLQAERRSTILNDLGLSRREYVLVTLHRPSNTDDAHTLQSILAGMATSRLPIVWPLHPRTKRRLTEFGLTVPKMVRQIDPVGYLDMVMLERHARLIATDSGGVQKEAFFHGVPCVTMRADTEWVELLDLGVNRLLNDDWALFGEVLAGEPPVFPSVDGIQPYGDGRAGERIASCIAG